MRLASLPRIQRETVERRIAELGAAGVVIDRDEPHDAHVFVTYVGGAVEGHVEDVIEGDGSLCDD